MLKGGDVFHDGKGYCLVYNHYHKGKNKYILRYIKLYTTEFKDQVVLNKDHTHTTLTNLSNLNNSLDGLFLLNE